LFENNNRHGFSASDILFSAYAKSISDLTNNRYVRFELLTTGRDNIIRGVDVSKTIGYFSEYVPVVIETCCDNDIVERISSWRRQFKQIPSAGLSFNALRYLCDDQSVRRELMRIPYAEFNINFIPPYIEDGSKKDDWGELPVDLIRPSNENVGRTHNPNLADIAWPCYIEILCYNRELSIKWMARDNIYKKETFEEASQKWIYEIEKTLDVLCRSG
jgi:hypothetical protein